MLEWKRRYNVGIRRIDLQHRKVMGIISHLYRLQTNDISAEEMRSLFRQLQEFIQTHFREEEALMLRYHYPGYAEHKREHDAFIDLVCEHQKDFLKNRPGVPINLFNILWDWFAHHILYVDQKYCTFFQSKGVA